MKNEYLDTVESLRVLPKFIRLILRDFKPKTKVPLKKNEVRTLIELQLNPDQPLSFYLNSIEMEKGSFTYVTDKLENKGLVNKVVSETDKRIIILQLSEKGSDVAADIDRQFQIHLIRKLSVFDESAFRDLKQASELIAKVYDDFNRLTK